jgi:hypothetical protein
VAQQVPSKPRSNVAFRRTLGDEDRHGGGGVGGAPLLVLVVVGAIVKYAVWIALFVGIALLVGGMVLWSLYLERRDEERRAADARIAARADQQHAWALLGDERGTYGDYPPEMRGCVP